MWTKLAILLCLAVVAAPPARAGEGPAATVDQALETLERRADRVRADVKWTHARLRPAPAPLAQDVARIRDAARALTHRLHGQPSAVAMPLLNRIDRLKKRLAGLDAQISAAPERPSRPPRHPSMLGAGAIAGRVTDARTGAPIDSGYVDVFDAAGDFVSDDFLDDTGAYQVGPLPAGTYYVRTSTFTHADEVYDDILCSPECEVTLGTPVTVIDGDITTGINFALLPLSVIEGTIIDATTWQPIAGAQLRLVDDEGGTRGFTDSDPDGRYRMVEVHPGVYYMRAEHYAYLDEAFDDVPCQPDCDPTTGQPIAVTVGSDVAGIDFRLQLGGSLSGLVIESGSGEPIPFTDVDVYDAGGAFLGSALAGQDGRYQQFDLTTGTYFAVTSSSAHADELYDNLPCTPSCDPTSGTPIAVSTGQERAGVDFALLRLGRFTGRVTNAAGLGLPGADVHVFNAQGSFEDGVFADELGVYTTDGLRGGTYFAVAIASRHLGELYQNLPCHPTCTPTTGSPVSVVLGGTTTGIDFSLDLGGWITGAVRRQVNGAPVTDARVTLFNAGGLSIDDAFAGENGNFVLEGLGPGTYYARAESFDFLPELYREIPCNPTCPPAQTGTAIPVVLGQASGGVDFTLTRLGRIGGRVSETGNGLPVFTLVRLHDSAGQEVDAESNGGVGGAYLFSRVPPGTYYLRTDSLSIDNIVDELYSNRTCEPSCTVTSGTPVPAALDTTTSGIDFSLRRPVFADVPVTHFAWRYVEAVYNAGVTAGCGGPPLRYCPDAAVSRAQMAVFLLRAKEGPAYLPPPATGVFSDVPAGDPFARWIEELVRRQVTGGCAGNPPRYCPNDPTTRAQMAPLLLVTREGSGYLPPPAVGVFSDVPANDLFARWIEELVRRQVTGGCGGNPPLYCPGAPTTRAQMAVFLTATFGLPLP